MLSMRKVQSSVDGSVERNVVIQDFPFATRDPCRCLSNRDTLFQSDFDQPVLVGRGPQNHLDVSGDIENGFPGQTFLSHQG